MESKETVLVTGCNGMLGSRTVEALLERGHTVVGVDITPMRDVHTVSDRFYFHMVDLADLHGLSEVFMRHVITHAIHLAALAHTAGQSDLSWERYYHINVECAVNIGSLAAEKRVPILFTSSADVYGITDGVVDPSNACHPVSVYAKSKRLGEEKLIEICQAHASPCTVMRLAPVYDHDQRRDIQKRYYLKYPSIAYRIGSGVEYEVLHIDNATSAMVSWVESPQTEGIIITNIKDPSPMRTADILVKEKREGRARLVVFIPRWLALIIYRAARAIAASSPITYLINKAINPIRTQ